MPIITFWSNNEKAIGQTVSASLAATIMAMEHNYKVLLISADYNDTVMEDCFGISDSNKEIVKTFVNKNTINLDSGINGLLKLCDSNRVTPEIIHDYTKIIFKNRLEVISSPINILEDKKNEIMDKFQNIISNAAKYYDYVIVDLKKGLKFNQQLEILQNSNIVVANIDQRIKTIQSYIETKEIAGMINKTIWNICKYDKNLKYNTKNIIRTILKKGYVYETDYNTLVFESAQEGDLVGLLIKFRTLKEDDTNKVFFNKIDELVQGIIFKNQEIRTKI